ncbi:hypothetical protein DCC81_23270 [Chitinophaga parva]|uniref:DUF1877 domain-containing protein n=1 Tax=Chitinophaga parva TaxID=2169414 RepID=A0A2T7BDY2_9BACT|nr:DUF1877 family protein [Chitinophaga parva]PUZ23309.1 hypothetical protein DCC81_23270 [Chitinophaga parva]
MSEVRTLYALPAKAFQALSGPGADPSKGAVAHARFQGSADALLFLLDKILISDEDTEILVNAIFYPDAFIGEAQDIDFSNWNAAHFEALGDAIEEGLHYQSPDVVAQIRDLLHTLDEVQVEDAYDAEELNENDIYPGEWTDDLKEGKLYNMLHLVNDFLVLKELMEKAYKHDCYIVCQ